MFHLISAIYVSVPTDASVYRSSVSPSAVAPAKTWYLTSATFTSTTASLYFNGSLQGTFPFTEDFVTSLIVGSAGGGNAFAGYVHSVQMWAFGLSPADHAALFASEAPLPPAPPSSPPSPPPAAPALRTGYGTLTDANPPIGVVEIVGPEEDVIAYNGAWNGPHRKRMSVRSRF